MQTYAKPRQNAGTDSVLAICLKTGKDAHLDHHDWVKCNHLEILNDQEFNMILFHTDESCYLVKSTDYQFANENEHVIKYRNEINGYLFNCCTNETEPNWARFQRLELCPVNSHVEPDGSTSCEAIDDPDAKAQADFYTIYGRLADPDEPLVEAITDIIDRREALFVAKRLSAIHGLPLHAPLFDLYDHAQAFNVKVFDVQIHATVTKTISVIAQADDHRSAIQKAYGDFRLSVDDTPEIFVQETLGIQAVCDVL